MSVPAGPPLPGGMGSLLQQQQQQQQHQANVNDGLSGPYPPSFPSGGAGGGGNGGVISAYHQGPGWDQLPRWGGGGAGQMSYGSSSTSVGGGNIGYGSGAGGGGGGSGGRPSYPPYPMPPAEHQTTGGGGAGYEQYPSTGYSPTAAGVGGGGGYNGGGSGGRNIPSFTPSSYYGNENSSATTTTASRGGASNIPTGPYPPSFQASDYGGGGGGAAGNSGALSSVLQSSYNPQLSAQQRKYPPILGGTSDPTTVASHLGGGMEDRSPSNGLGGAGGGGASLAGLSVTSSTGMSSFPSGGTLDGPKRVTQSNANSGNISPASNISNSSGIGTNTVGAVSSTTMGGGGGGFPRTTASSFVSGGSGGTLAGVSASGTESHNAANDAPILPKRIIPDPSLDNYEDDDMNMRSTDYHGIPIPNSHDSLAKKRDWLLTMNATLESTPIGQLDPNTLPLSTIMNGWAKQKSSEGARMVEMWLDRVHSEYNAENPGVHPTARMYTMAVDAWAKSNGGAPAARRAEALLERMDRLYREGGGRHEALKPTTGIFNAVINVSL